VPQFYLGFPSSASEPPKVLRGFEKVFLEGGQSREVRRQQPSPSFLFCYSILNRGNNRCLSICPVMDWIYGAFRSTTGNLCLAPSQFMLAALPVTSDCAVLCEHKTCQPVQANNKLRIRRKRLFDFHWQKGCGLFCRELEEAQQE